MAKWEFDHRMKVDRDSLSLLRSHTQSALLTINNDDMDTGDPLENLVYDLTQALELAKTRYTAVKKGER